jgi:hypothetical protein
MVVLDSSAARSADQHSAGFMRGSKWIPGTRPKQGVVKAARRALQVRLGEACRLMPLAARHADEDIEHVHQLRVASRRAVAALDVFWDSSSLSLTTNLSGRGLSPPQKSGTSLNFISMVSSWTL